MGCSGSGGGSTSRTSKPVFLRISERSNVLISRARSTSGWSPALNPPTSSRFIPVVSTFWGAGSITCTSTVPARRGSAPVTHTASIMPARALPGLRGIPGIPLRRKDGPVEAQESIVVLPDLVVFGGQLHGFLVGFPGRPELPQALARHRQVVVGTGVGAVGENRLLEAESRLVP